MRLMMVTQDFPPETGGIQTYAHSHAIHLARRCEWFCVVCPAKKGSEEIDGALPFPVFRIRSRNELLVWPLCIKLKKWIRKYRVDATLHTQWQTAYAALHARATGWKGAVFAAAHGRELYFHPYRSIPLLNPLFLRYRSRVLQGIDHLYPVSHFTENRLHSMGVEPDRTTVVINGTDPQTFYPDRNRSLRGEWGLVHKKIVLTVTRLVKRKGVDLVLEALAKVAKSVEGVHYVIVGDGPERSGLEKKVYEMNLSGSVTFLGRVAYKDLNRIYNSADLFVMPSRTRLPDVEGFGIVFLEANACGLPVIGSDSGGIHSAIEDGVTGYIVPEENSDKLADRIRELLLSPEKAGAMGQAGRRRVERVANWESCSRELFDAMNTRITLTDR